MPETRSSIRLRSSTLMHGEDPIELFIELYVTCDECGEYVLQLAGHHVRPIIELLQEVVAREPEMTAAGHCEATQMREWRIWPENN